MKSTERFPASQEIELSENTPNAARVVSALRHLGYTNVSAICDITDNSVDAGASEIHLWIKENEDNLLFRLIDNGQGMDSEELDQALRLGSITKKDSLSDLGLYGMGLVTASISMAKRVAVMTRKNSGPVLFSIFDVDQAMENNRFDNLRGPANSEDISLFEEYMGQNDGTIITLTKCDRLQFKGAETYANKLRKEFGQVYRLFLGNRLKIWINGELVEPIDPLMAEHEETEIFMDKVISFSLSKNEEPEEIRVRLVKLPDFGTQGNRERKINQANQGFYVIRNFREIAKGEWFGLHTKHNILNRVRAEIYVNGRFDDALGVNFTKRDLALSQGLSHKIAQEVSGQIETIAAQIKKSQTKKDVSGIKHEDSAKQIISRAKLLVKPEQVNLDDGEVDTNLTYGDLGVRFETENLGRQGQIYEAEQWQNDILVKWNVDHPFYERFVLENRDNKDMVGATDFLVYCWASAELSFREDSPQRHMFINFKTMISANLRTLLS